jgi:hypothetical protein
MRPAHHDLEASLAGAAQKVSGNSGEIERSGEIAKVGIEVTPVLGHRR